MFRIISTLLRSCYILTLRYPWIEYQANAKIYKGEKIIVKETSVPILFADLQRVDLCVCVFLSKKKFDCPNFF